MKKPKFVKVRVIPQKPLKAYAIVKTTGASFSAGSEEAYEYSIGLDVSFFNRKPVYVSGNDIIELTYGPRNFKVLKRNISQEEAWKFFDKLEEKARKRSH